MSEWTQEEAIEFCRRLELFAPSFGCHIGLTGGLLYKQDPPTPRKDLDIVVYRIRQVETINFDGLVKAMEDFLDAKFVSYHGFVTKLKVGEKKIDMLFPEIEGNYEPE